MYVSCDWKKRGEKQLSNCREKNSVASAVLCKKYLSNFSLLDNNRIETHYYRMLHVIVIQTYTINNFIRIN